MGIANHGKYINRFSDVRMFDVTFITINVNAAALDAPNTFMDFDADQNTMENANGNAKNVRIIAKYGSGLKL